jgi:hypothetical protein
METHFVYRNWRRNRGRIHLAECSYCNHGKGTQASDSGQNGEWKGYCSRELAFKAAEAMRVTEVKACPFCKP